MLALAMLALQPLYWAPARVSATSGWTPPWCDVGPYQPGSNKFVGRGLGSTNIRGARATVEWFDESLCRQPNVFQPEQDTWSLSWVAIVGNGNEIFQVGFAKCPPSGFCPYNNGISFHFWFWEYPAGACGAAADSGFRKANKGDVTGGAHVYSIDYRPAASRYSASIDGTDQTWIPTSTPSTCWGGIVGAQYMNEMLDLGDQNGGTLSDHQEMTIVGWQDASQNWHVANIGPPGSCPTNSNPSAWTCNIASNSNTIVSWDRRAP